MRESHEGGLKGGAGSCFHISLTLTLTRCLLLVPTVSYLLAVLRKRFRRNGAAVKIQNKWRRHYRLKWLMRDVCLREQVRN